MVKLLLECICHLDAVAQPLTQRGQALQWGPRMMGNWGYSMMGWFGPIMMLVFWGLIIAVLILIVRWLWASAQKKPEPPAGDTPVDILNRRHARGEIDREEFEQRKRDLS